MENPLVRLPVSMRRAASKDLRHILDIIDSWPTHLVNVAKTLIEADFNKHHSIVAVTENKVIGFLIWRTDGSEIELLWMAVSPETVRHGIGTKLVRYVLDSIGNEEHVFLLTATEDSTIPNTEFSGTSFSGTNKFFTKLGFKDEGILQNHWGKTNHALKLGLTLRPSKD